MYLVLLIAWAGTGINFQLMGSSKANGQPNFVTVYVIVDKLNSSHCSIGLTSALHL